MCRVTIHITTVYLSQRLDVIIVLSTAIPPVRSSCNTPSARGLCFSLQSRKQNQDDEIESSIDEGGVHVLIYLVSDRWYLLTLPRLQPSGSKENQ